MIVDRLPWHPGDPDAHGNAAPGWGEADPVEVFGHQPAQTDVQVDGRDTLVEQVELLIPPGFTADHRDRFVVEGRTYRCDGAPRWYTGSPFGYAPGGTLRLVHATGG